MADYGSFIEEVDESDDSVEEGGESGDAEPRKQVPETVPVKGKEARGKKKKKKYKKKKQKKEKIRNDLKTAMASERTFFKWIWTAFHVGGIGTFVLGFYADAKDPYRLWLVSFCWVIAFACIFFGLALYYRRRRALRTGMLYPQNWDYAYSPVIVVAAFTTVMAAVVLYAFYTHRESYKANLAGV